MALRAHAPCPSWSRGVLHPEDAREALRCGARGLVVSNHGGRVLDGVPATAVQLPRLRDALQHATGPDTPCLLVDGGIRRGTDVLKALALGADAVMLGRPQVCASPRTARMAWRVAWHCCTTNSSPPWRFAVCGRLTRSAPSCWAEGALAAAACAAMGAD